MAIVKLLKAVSYAGVKRQAGETVDFPRSLIDALLANGAAELVCDGACPFPVSEPETAPESGEDLPVEVEVEEPERRTRRSRKAESEED